MEKNLEQHVVEASKDLSDIELLNYTIMVIIFLYIKKCCCISALNFSVVSKEIYNLTKGLIQPLTITYTILPHKLEKPKFLISATYIEGKRSSRFSGEDVLRIWK